VSDFATKRLADQPDATALDGSDVRVLLQLKGGSLAQFQFRPGETSRAVAHRTVEEIWYITGGRGELWRSLDSHEEIVAIGAGVCVTIPVGTQFQVRAFGEQPLTVIGVTLPPWPGEGEAYPVQGKWTPTLHR